MRDQKSLLEAMGHEVQLFAHSADRATSREVEVVPDSLQLAVHPSYHHADLAVFHFGVHYRMFNALLLDHGPRKVVHFHNVTPPEILEGAARALSVSSLDQLSIAEYADEVWSVSAHNTEVLLAHSEVAPDRVHMMELRVPAADHPLPRRGVAPGEPVQLLSVGRFVASKGLDDLVEAVGRLDPDLGPVRLVLAGSRTFSDPELIEDLSARCDSLPGHVEAMVVEGPDDRSLSELYRTAHVYVTASRHEGFCLPVFEAMASGCRVVATSAGALPDSVGPCGVVVPVADPDALAAAVAAQIGSARQLKAHPAGELDRPCRDHLARVSTDCCRTRLLTAVDRVLARPRR
jgi:glycosyltransferase involved in cell wall biosynthesis